MKVFKKVVFWLAMILAVLGILTGAAIQSKNSGSSMVLSAACSIAALIFVIKWAKGEYPGTAWKAWAMLFAFDLITAAMLLVNAGLPAGNVWNVYLVGALIVGAGLRVLLFGWIFSEQRKAKRGGDA